jgi:hypothetical protein
MLQQILSKLEAYGSVKVSGNRIRVCIPSKSRDERLTVLRRACAEFQDFCAVLLNDRPDYSSIGYIQIDNFKICVKSLRQQSSLSPGISNEQVLVNKIDKYIKTIGCINLIFYCNGFQIKYDDVVDCYATKNRKLHKGRNKADMVIETVKSKYGVSIKQHDAERWESADTSFGAVARQKLEQAITSGKTQLVQATDSDGNPIYRSGDATRPVMRLATELYWRMDEHDQRKIIFGDDVCEGGAVIVNTFNDAHFAYDSDTRTLRVACDRLYTPSTPIRCEDQPYWMIRNDITRNCKKLGILGLRIESVFESRIKYGVEV